MPLLIRFRWVIGGGGEGGTRGDFLGFDESAWLMLEVQVVGLWVW